MVVVTRRGIDGVLSSEKYDSTAASSDDTEVTAGAASNDMDQLWLTPPIYSSTGFIEN